MKQLFGLASILFLVFLSSGCQRLRRKPEPARPIITAPAPAVTPETPIAAPTPPPAPAVVPCEEYGDSKHFNEQRIAAFQQMIVTQMAYFRTLPPSEDVSPHIMPKLDILRRRARHPYLQPLLPPKTVTRQIRREIEYLVDTLEVHDPGTANTINTLNYIHQKFLPLLENRDEWNCLKKKVEPPPEEAVDVDLELEKPRAATPAKPVSSEPAAPTPSAPPAPTGPATQPTSVPTTPPTTLPAPTPPASN
ncbi:MAG: hypothetical protein ACK5Y2_03435 [Bdellovibrionales bacterium]